MQTCLKVETVKFHTKSKVEIKFSFTLNKPNNSMRRYLLLEMRTKVWQSQTRFISPYLMFKAIFHGRQGFVMKVFHLA